MSGLIEAHIIEDVELQFRSPVAHFRNSTIFQIAFCLLCDIARVAAVALARDRIEHIADQIQSGNFKNRIHTGRLRVGDQQHVTFVDQLESADTGAVKTDAFLKQVVAQVLHGDREMLPDSKEIHELQIHNLHPCLSREFLHFTWSLGHDFGLLSRKDVWPG